MYPRKYKQFYKLTSVYNEIVIQNFSDYDIFNFENYILEV